MVNLVKVLVDLGHRVTYLPQNRVHGSEREKLRQLAAAMAIDLPRERSVHRHLRRTRGLYRAAILCRPGPTERFLPSLRRQSPDTWVVFDTVDLHHLRELRQSEVQSDPALKAAAMKVRQRELDLVEAVDETLVVSTAERDILLRERPRSRVRVLPTIHSVGNGGPPFEGRSGLLFLGGFQHAPNVDAATWLVESIMPRVWEHLPDVELHLVGSHPPPAIERLQGSNVEVHGWVPTVEPFLNRSRLSVAPLRFGAGVKGKLTQSLAAGLPSVATELGAEGMPIEHERDILIATGAEDLARGIVRAYCNEDLWYRLAVTGRRTAARHFSFDAARLTVAALLDEIPSPVRGGKPSA